jgi:hypothetical protein
VRGHGRGERLQVSRCPAKGAAQRRDLSYISGVLLGGEQGAFAFEAPAVAGEAAVFADDAVARDNDGDGIGGAGAGDGADGLGMADAACDFGVRAGLAAGNAPELFPDAALKGGSADIERNFTVGGAGAQASDHGPGPDSDAAGIFAELGAREIARQLAEELGIGFSEHDGADAARGSSDEKAAERRIHNGIADFEAGSAAAVIAGSHAELGTGALIEAARGAVSSVVDGRGHVSSLAQAALEAPQAQCVCVLSRGDAEHAAKQPEQTKGAEARLASESVESRTARVV